MSIKDRRRKIVGKSGRIGATNSYGKVKVGKTNGVRINFNGVGVDVGKNKIVVIRIGVSLIGV